MWSSTVTEIELDNRMVVSDGSTSCRVVPEDSVNGRKSEGLVWSSKVPEIELANSMMGSDVSTNCRVVPEDSVSCRKSDGVVWSSKVPEGSDAECCTEPELNKCSKISVDVSTSKNIPSEFSR